MLKLIQPFDPNQHDPSQSSGSLPVGRHKVVIDGGEVKPTSANDGGMLVLNLKIIEGPNTNVTGPYRLNLYNSSEKAVKIANSQLSALCHVTQQFRLGADGTDVTVLFNIPFYIEVVYQKGEDPAQNSEAKGYTEIKRVFDVNGNEPGKQANNQQQSNNGNSQFQQQNNQQQNNNQQANAGNWGQGNNQQQNQQQNQQASNWAPNQQQANNQQQSNNQGGGGWQGNNGAGGQTQGGTPSWAK